MQLLMVINATKEKNLVMQKRITGMGTDNRGEQRALWGGAG